MKKAVTVVNRTTVRKENRRRGAPSGPRKADERRAALLEAASTLFVKKGYEATTMDEIAATANFAKGTLYHYFASKVELLQVLREDFEAEVMRSIRSQMNRYESDDWSGRIRGWIAGAVEAYFAMSKLHDVVIYGSGMPFRNAMADAEITSNLTNLLSDGVKAGAWRVNDPHWTAVVMFYSFRGGCDEAMLGTLRAEELPDKLNDLFLRILAVNS
ncbi:MAG: TetR/AcrR family transcriptional regulator [Desulfopila sp.]